MRQYTCCSPSLRQSLSLYKLSLQRSRITLRAWAVAVHYSCWQLELMAAAANTNTFPAAERVDACRSCSRHNWDVGQGGLEACCRLCNGATQAAGHFWAGHLPLSFQVAKTESQESPDYLRSLCATDGPCNLLAVGKTTIIAELSLSFAQVYTMYGLQECVRIQSHSATLF